MILGISNIQLCMFLLQPDYLDIQLTFAALNVISPFLGGYMIPGKPIAVMVFKVFSTITLGQA